MPAMHQLIRLAYLAAFAAFYMYVDGNFSQPTGLVLLVCFFGGIWLIKKCFPLIYRLDRSLMQDDDPGEVGDSER